MDGLVFLLVLVGAALHAGWNALVKRGTDRVIAMGHVALGAVPFAVPLIFCSAFPTPRPGPGCSAQPFCMRPHVHIDRGLSGGRLHPGLSDGARLGADDRREFLKEPLTRWRVAAVTGILAGVILIRLGA